MFSKNLASLFAITGLLLSGLASAQGIAGSAHDFSGDVWSGGEICIVCHAAHDADLSVAAEAPLWNHEITTSTFLEYSSGTLDGTVTNDLNTTSKLCLSCHDGTVALDSFGGATGTELMTGGALLSTDLTNDHPVSIDYNVTDTGLFPVGSASGLGSTIDSDLLFGGNVECASCHDVHDTAGNAALLRIDNAGSALCLTCHNK